MKKIEPSQDSLKTAKVGPTNIEQQPNAAPDSDLVNEEQPLKATAEIGLTNVEQQRKR